MNTDEPLTLDQQKELLQRKLQGQRQRLVNQLTPKKPGPNDYPRSMTMRFLTKRNGAKWLASTAAGLLGAKTFKSVSAAIVVSKMVSSLFAQQQARRSAASFDTTDVEVDVNPAEVPLTVTLERPPNTPETSYNS